LLDTVAIGVCETAMLLLLQPRLFPIASTFSSQPTAATITSTIGGSGT
jgi:hypothetical protein